MRDGAEGRREDPWADDELLAAEARSRRLALRVLGFCWLLAALVIVSVVLSHPTGASVAILVLAVVAPPVLRWLSRAETVQNRLALKRTIGVLAIALSTASLGLAALAAFHALEEPAGMERERIPLEERIGHELGVADRYHLDRWQG